MHSVSGTETRYGLDGSNPGGHTQTLSSLLPSRPALHYQTAAIDVLTVTWRNDYKIPEDDTIVSKHVGRGVIIHKLIVIVLFVGLFYKIILKKINCTCTRIKRKNDSLHDIFGSHSGF
jgi:hypothetical protein